MASYAREISSDTYSIRGITETAVGAFIFSAGEILSNPWAEAGFMITGAAVAFDGVRRVIFGKD